MTPTTTDREAVARAHYKFSRDGGAIGDIVLTGDAVPSGAIVLDSLIKVETPPDSAEHTGTIALKLQSAADLQAAKKVEEAPWSTAGAKRGSALTATSTPITTTAQRKITATVATKALTTGKFSVYVRYLLPHAE